MPSGFRSTCQTRLPLPGSRALTCTAPSIAKTRPCATIGCDNTLVRRDAPSPMPVSQARAILLGRDRWTIAWAGLPPGSGHSGLATGGGRVTASLASCGSGSNRVSRPSTEIRSPASGCFLSRSQSQAAGASDSNSAAKSRRFIAQTDRAKGTRLRREGGRQLGGAGTQPLRRAEIVGDLPVEIECGVAIAGFELRCGGQFERAGAPRVTILGERLQPLDRRLRVTLGKAVHDRQQHRQIAEFRVESGGTGEPVIGGDRRLAVAGLGQQFGLLE